MTQVGDVIRIKSCQELFGQELCNVFYYIVSAWTGNSDLLDVINEFSDTVVFWMKTIQTDDLSYVNFRADNITDELDFAELPVGIPGTYPGSETMAPFITAAFRLARKTKLTRPGFKRISGISEDLVNDGEIDVLAAIFTGIMAILAAPLVIVTPAPGDGLLTPIIVGRNTDGSYDLARLNPITSAVVQPHVTSQNTRKVGR